MSRCVYTVAQASNTLLGSIPLSTPTFMRWMSLRCIIIFFFLCFQYSCTGDLFKTVGLEPLGGFPVHWVDSQSFYISLLPRVACYLARPLKCPSAMFLLVTLDANNSAPQNYPGLTPSPKLYQKLSFLQRKKNISFIP